MWCSSILLLLYLPCPTLLQATPLHKAVAYGHTEVVRLLLEAGADATAPAGADASAHTALHLAAINGFTDIAQLLLQQPSVAERAWDTNIRDLTALELAVREGHEQVRMFLAPCLLRTLVL
jgi:ankyrin repeat protein